MSNTARLVYLRDESNDHEVVFIDTSGDGDNDELKELIDDGYKVVDTIDLDYNLDDWPCDRPLSFF